MIDVDWPQALAAEQTYLTRLTKDLRGFITRGADISTAARDAAKSEASRWQLFGVYNARNATGGLCRTQCNENDG